MYFCALGAALNFRECDADLTLVFPAAILLGRFAHVVGRSLEKYDLGHAFVGVDLGG
jgi:hypothetical protein